MTRLAELMGRYCDGEIAAFERLYALLAPTLLAELLAALPDRETAEAALEQTFLRLHDSRSVYVRGADPLPWVRAMARHAASRAGGGATAVAVVRRARELQGGAR